MSEPNETRVVYVDELGLPSAWWELCEEEALDDPVWRPFALSNKGEIYSPAFLPLPGSQMLFLECPVFEALYHGNRGPGKTITLLMDFAREVGKGYGSAWRGILFRRHFKDLDDVVKKMEEFFPKMFPGWRFLRSKSEYMAIWPSGEALLIRHIRDEDDYADYHGHEYPWQGWEELTQWPDDKVFKLMQSCCRSAQPGIPSRVRSTTNPHGTGHIWVKKRYDLPQSDGQVIKLPGQMPRVAIRGSLRENFLLLSIQPHYEIIIKNAAKNPAQAKAWIEGDWNVTSGGMFDDLWDYKYHVIPNIPVDHLPHSWTITRAYDHGQSHPFSVGWWLESSGESIDVDGVTIGNVRGDLILWMEWYGTTGEENTGIRLAASKIAQGIIDREDDIGVHNRVMDGPADTEIYTKVATGSGRGPADDMEDAGVTWEKADKTRGSRKRGWEKIRTMLSNAMPGQDGTREHPGLFICKKNKHWLELAPSVPRSEQDQDEIPERYEDHCLHPDTIVVTREGSFKISDLVGKGGEVMTTDGWKSYYGARLTRKDAEMVKLTFSDGSNIVCTPDHEIMLESGDMLEAVDSIGAKCYHTTSCPERSNILSPRYRNLGESGTTYVENIFKIRESGFIERCGRSITDIYPVGWTFTTWTRILKTMIYPICQPCCRLITLGITGFRTGSTLGGYNHLESNRLVFGIIPQKVKIGIKRIIKSMSRIRFWSWENAFANNAGISLEVESGSANFAQEDVEPSGAGTIRLTTSGGRVSSAGKNITEADMTSRDFVLEVVQVNPEEISDSYCLTVPDMGHFMLENGVFVSNCLDMTRYRVTWEVMGMFRRGF